MAILPLVIRTIVALCYSLWSSALQLSSRIYTCFNQMDISSTLKRAAHQNSFKNGVFEPGLSVLHGYKAQL